MLFERLLKSRDKDGVLQLANKGQTSEHPIDIIKDPYALEFLGLPESHRLLESDLETALTTHMQEFLLELGAGFAFVARQKRLTLDGDHFYADLVFYHVRLKCYVIIDLKTEKLAHGDIGQMQMYVHYFDREICTQEDNPTIGLILCTDKNNAVVETISPPWLGPFGGMKKQDELVEDARPDPTTAFATRLRGTAQKTTQPESFKDRIRRKV